MDTPRIVIGGVGSGVGKTVLSIGLMKALTDRGLSVAPFKAGPDYIDPMHHRAATGRGSRNLDSYILSRDALLRSFAAGCENAQIAVIEGVMGLFDSHDSIDERGSTAQTAKILKAPVILTVGAKKMARSAAPLIRGFKDFDPEVDVAGVVLNMVGSERHREKVKEAVEELAGVEVLGALPDSPSLRLPERHLGLVPIHETESDLKPLASLIEEYVDMDRVLEIARSAGEIEVPDAHGPGFERGDVRIGIVYDRAFRFYYTETLAQLSAAGNVTYIDALKDRRLPPIDLLYIGGGFPEVFAEELEKNRRFRADVHDFCARGGRVYGECGGLMYLGESIITGEGRFEMVGFLPIETEMQDSYVGMGYTINRAVKDNLLCRRGETILGHEFHHSRAILKGKVDFAFRTERGAGIDGAHDGIMKDNVLAGYMHVHPLGYGDMVKNLVRGCRLR
ncbi:MAG: hydrogenobyrinic acid a,c-diamide synthase (glutamine-hydrolyzing) [Methanobacteriota archaeon]|nr:MAG: hydrogenobyrinic acid a,c-diamide synthase (glutamine-hydrolyzing) [Euryarchaeota archaeon]